MDDTEIDIRETAQPLIEDGAFQQAEALLEERLSQQARAHFKSLIGKGFKNDPRDIAKNIAAFKRFCEKDFPLQALYLEMSDNDWKVDLFGFAKRLDEECPDEDLSEFDSGDWPGIQLLGLDDAREEFDDYHAPRNPDRHDPAVQRAALYAEWLVACKFFVLVQRSVTSFVPNTQVFASVHDWDVIACIK